MNRYTYNGIKEKIEDGRTWAKKKANSNVVTKIIASLIIAFGTFIPVYVLGLFWWIANPAGFWEKLAVIVLWAFVLGWLQILCLIGGCILIAGILLDEL
jgi:hypothetical protein